MYPHARKDNKILNAELDPTSDVANVTKKMVDGRDHSDVRVIKHLRCNFCGKDAAEVFMLIQGPSVQICNECVLQCADLVMTEILRRETKLTKVVSFDKVEDNENE